MITNTDIKKMSQVLATKDELIIIEKRMEKTENKLVSLEEKMNLGFTEIINFIGEVRTELANIFSNNLEELREITRRQQILLENHD